MKVQLKQFQEEYKKNIVTAVSAGLAFVIALAWRDAIQGIIQRLVEYLGLVQPENPYVAKIITALFVTAIAVLMLVLLSRWSFGRPEG